MMKYQILDQPAILSYIFHPCRCERTSPPENAVDIKIETEPGTMIGCRFYINTPESPNILYFHGNGETVADYDDIGPLYNQSGMNLLVTDYRGYGWSTGNPTVTSMFTDAEILFQKSQDWIKFNKFSGAFFLMGRSLGSVVAIDLATQHKADMKGLIIESGIGGTIPLAETLGFDNNSANLTEEDGFNNLKKIESVTIPTFIFHGALDEIIAANEAEKLQAHSGARSKEFIIIPGASHNTMISIGGRLYFETIKNFIDKVTGMSNWRRRRKMTNNS